MGRASLRDIYLMNFVGRCHRRGALQLGSTKRHLSHKFRANVVGGASLRDIHLANFVRRCRGRCPGARRRFHFPYKSRARTLNRLPAAVSEGVAPELLKNHWFYCFFDHDLNSRHMRGAPNHLPQTPSPRRVPLTKRTLAPQPDREK